MSRSAPRPAVGVTSTRVRALSPAARTVHRAILRAFATTGQAPDPAALVAPAGHDLRGLLAELHERDVVRLDGHEQIRAAYPFSGVPTPHRVAITGGPTVYAMCAIDALGIAAMLDARVSVTSTDPGTAEPITVDVRPDGHSTWHPDTAVVFDGADTTMSSDGCCAPGDGPSVAPAADRCCGVMNFFTGTASAQAWLAAHPHVSGAVLTQAEALRTGVYIFGHLLEIDSTP